MGRSFDVELSVYVADGNRVRWRAEIVNETIERSVVGYGDTVEEACLDAQRVYQEVVDGHAGR